MTPFAIATPQRILFGRGEAAKAPALIAPFGTRGLVIHGANPARAAWLIDALHAQGCEILSLPCAAEPDLPMLEAVGFPVAVNPETRLAAIARKRGWLVEDWAKASGAARLTTRAS